MVTLGGSLFTHDALRQDYCLEAALDSLLDLCDEVVVLDAESTDGTYEYLMERSKHTPELRIVQGEWNCKPDSSRLAELANKAKSFLSTKYHFMLQADEVIHENSFDAVRHLINKSFYDSFTCKRLNFWKDSNYIVPEGSQHAPCSSSIVRLGLTTLDAYGDAESLRAGSKHYQSIINVIQIFHYGMIRDGFKLVDKCIEMQSWFFGEGSQPDPRIVEMKKSGLPFQPDVNIPDNALVRFYGDHPKYIAKWLKERGR